MSAHKNWAYRHRYQKLLILSFTFGLRITEASMVVPVKQPFYFLLSAHKVRWTWLEIYSHKHITLRCASNLRG